VACACNKNRATASGTASVSGTYRVLVNGVQRYESANKAAAESVASNFDPRVTRLLVPGESA